MVDEDIIMDQQAVAAKHALVHKHAVTDKRTVADKHAGMAKHAALGTRAVRGGTTGRRLLFLHAWVCRNLAYQRRQTGRPGGGKRRRNLCNSARRLIDEIVRRRYLKTYLFDFCGSVPLHPRFETVLCATTLVDISDPEWVPPDRKLLSQIRKADREGIRVEPFLYNCYVLRTGLGRIF